MNYANKNNFYINSEADFEYCEKPDRECDYISASGSEYWYSEDGVYRNSDHWGNGIASCDWQLLNCCDWDVPQYELTYKTLCGFAKWDAFKLKEINATIYVEKEENIDFDCYSKLQKTAYLQNKDGEIYNKLVWDCKAKFNPTFDDLDENNNFILPNGKKIAINKEHITTIGV